MTKELLQKFLNNQCSENELQLVIEWIKSGKEYDKGRYHGLKEWREFVPKENDWDPDFNVLLGKIHHEINVQESVRKKDANTLVRRGFYYLNKIAAVLLLPLLGIIFFMVHKPMQLSHFLNNQLIDTIEVSAPVGSRSMVVLEDGTKVFLNHGSKLRYPQRFIGKKREVELIGEAYFEVAHSAKQPFVVNAGDIDIKALGTSFNVMAYSDDNVIETTLTEGKVVIEKEVNGKHREIVSMVPNQHIKFNKRNGKIRCYKGNVEKYTAWRDGRLILDNDPIDVIANKLARWYNVEIVFANNKVKKYTYTGTFVDETIIQILDLMTIATPITYTSTTREKQDSGIYSKQKIIIDNKN